MIIDMIDLLNSNLTKECDCKFGKGKTYENDRMGEEAIQN